MGRRSAKKVGRREAMVSVEPGGLAREGQISDRYG
jgi:hypothetical protein